MATNGTSTPPGLEVPGHEEVRDAVLRDIEVKVAEKMEEVWQKGRQMLAQVHQKQQEKTDQLLLQIQQCREQQDSLERENVALKQVLTTMASHLSQLGLEKPAGGYSSPPTTAASVNTTPQKSERHTPQREAPSPEVPAFPFSLAEALGTPTPLSLANALATEVVWPQVFHMTLRKADGAELGLNVKPLDGPKVLLVDGVRPDGAVEAWNRQCVSSAHPERAILPGDRIISVNSVSYEPDKMLEECRDKQLLKLTLLRGECEASASPTLRADASEFVPKAAGEA